MKDVAKGKTLGADGLPVEFCQSYADILALQLARMYYANTEPGRLPAITSEALIVSLPKPHSPTLYRPAYRLFETLNLDFKILSKIL